MAPAYPSNTTDTPTLTVDNSSPCLVTKPQVKKNARAST